MAAVHGEFAGEFGCPIHHFWIHAVRDGSLGENDTPHGEGYTPECATSEDALRKAKEYVTGRDDHQAQISAQVRSPLEPTTYPSQRNTQRLPPWARMALLDL